MGVKLSVPEKIKLSVPEKICPGKDPETGLFGDSSVKGTEYRSS
jgi:hypothetical protein